MDRENVIDELGLHASRIMCLLNEIVPEGYCFALTIDHGREFVVEFMREDERHHEMGGGPDAAEVMRYAFNERLPKKRAKP